MRATNIRRKKICNFYFLKEIILENATILVLLIIRDTFLYKKRQLSFIYLLTFNIKLIFHLFNNWLLILYKNVIFFPHKWMFFKKSTKKTLPSTFLIKIIKNLMFFDVATTYSRLNYHETAKNWASQTRKYSLIY